MSVIRTIIVIVLFKQGNCFRAIGGFGHSKSGIAHSLGQDQADQELVLDQKNPDAGHVASDEIGRVCNVGQ